jgi:hypothetical protein
MASNISTVRAGVMSADETRAEVGLDLAWRADELVTQSVSGRPPDAGDGEGRRANPPRLVSSNGARPRQRPGRMSYLC